MKKFFLITILFCFALRFLNAQEIQGDSITTVDTTVVKHSPRKAVIMSAVIPGLGQVYNQKYWKVPIIYAAIGTLTYFIIDYNKKYKTYVNAYDEFMDSDPNTNSFEKIRGLANFEDKEYFLEYYRDFYHRWRDLDVLILVGVYALNIIDANVDAHFFNFEIDDDLSLNVKPILLEPLNNSKFGVSLSLKF